MQVLDPGKQYRILVGRGKVPNNFWRLDCTLIQVSCTYYRTLNLKLPLWGREVSISVVEVVLSFMRIMVKGGQLQGRYREYVTVI